MNRVSWVFAVTCLLLAAAVIGLWSEIDRQQALVSQLRKDLAFARNSAPVSAQPPARSAPVSSKADAAPRSSSPGSRHEEIDTALKKDPRFRAAMLDYRRIESRQRYAALLASLRLPADKADRVASILAEQEVQGMHGIPPEFTREQWRQKNEDELRSELSQVQIDSLRHYRETAATREQVESLRNELMSTREPLQDAQIAPLIESLHTEEMRLFEDASAFNEALDKSPGALEESERSAEKKFVELEAAATERKLSAASAILSREQLAALERQLEMQRSLGLAGSKLRQLEREFAKSPP